MPSQIQTPNPSIILALFAELFMLVSALYTHGSPLCTPIETEAGPNRSDAPQPLRGTFQSLG